MKKKIIEAFGWYGTAAIIMAYGLTSFGILHISDTVYQLLNLTGAIGIVTVSFYKKAYQSGVLNIIWSIIALIAILKTLLAI